jgi:hypothetical protein
LFLFSFRAIGSRLINLPLLQMVGGTRSTPGGFYQGEGSGTTGGQGPPPPPPPPPNPTLAQVFAAQNEILRQLAQGQQQFQ